MLIYKKIFTNKDYVSANGFDKISFFKYLAKKDEMSESLKTKMKLAWKWDEPVS